MNSYGNDCESILKVIALYEKENKKAIDIIDIIDIEQFKIIGYINYRTKGLGIIILENLNSHYFLRNIQNENIEKY